MVGEGVEACGEVGENLRCEDRSLTNTNLFQHSVVASNTYVCRYVLGFRIDPTEKLHTVHKELLALFGVYSITPVFGVEFASDANNQPSKVNLNIYQQYIININNTLCLMILLFFIRI